MVGAHNGSSYTPPCNNNKVLSTKGVRMLMKMGMNPIAIKHRNYFIWNPDGPPNFLSSPQTVPLNTLSSLNTPSVGFSRILLQKQWPGKQSMIVRYTLITFYDLRATRKNRACASTRIGEVSVRSYR